MCERRGRRELRTRILGVVMRGIGGLHSKEAVLGGATARCAPWALNVVDMVGQGDKQVEKKLGAAVEHLLLHGSAALEGGAAANDEGEVVCSQLGVGIGRVGIGEAGRGEDDATGDAGA